MLEKLNDIDKKITNEIKAAAKNAGVNAYIVGGVVRDLLMGRIINDIDFLIEGSAIEFAKNAGFKIKSAHEAFNTVKVEILNKETDIASTRIETYKAMGALPTVIKTGVKIEDDIKRRDFTINSIALNILSDELIDPYNGIEDIKKGSLKILHDKSFLDDPTRILRGLDFKYRFNFEFEKNTFELLKAAAKNFNREFLSFDRIYSTLNKVFSYGYSDKILNDILEFKIYKIWLNKTDLTADKIESLNNAAKIFSLQNRSALYIQALEAPYFIKPPLKNDFEIYDFFKKFSPNQLALYYFKTGDNSAVRYLKIKDVKAAINGDVLIKLGFKQGEFIGIILKDILKEKLLNPENIKTKEDEINFVLKNYSTE